MKIFDANGKYLSSGGFEHILAPRIDDEIYARGLWRLNGRKTLLMALGSRKASFAVIDCMRGPMDGAQFVNLGLRIGRAPIVSPSMCKS